VPPPLPSPYCLSGRLESVTLRLSSQSIPPVPLAPIPLQGLEAYLLTVTVIDPNGLATEVTSDLLTPPSLSLSLSL
jgi:hypothetical protein